MLSPKVFVESLINQGIECFAGVPDSILKPLCSYVNGETSLLRSHVICANEGGAVGFAAGYYLSTGKIAAVYMQNSGLGNCVNPLLSLADPEVYSIPMLLIIGWRGEPGSKDEPQHKKQGRVTLSLLEVMEIPYEVISPEAAVLPVTLGRALSHFKEKSAPYALVVKKGIFESYEHEIREGSVRFNLKREEAIKIIANALDPNDAVISTTGMISRELFECRNDLQQGHNRDFLTVGSMGHASQIAIAIAAQKPERRIFCIDGDGSLLMHMGALAINGTSKCSNFHHILINNGAHDSVGGQPTVGFEIDFRKIAQAVGYKKTSLSRTADDIRNHFLENRGKEGPFFMEVCVNKGHRSNLGRPTISPLENKRDFMEFLK